jgi:hypothetical protein
MTDQSTGLFWEASAAARAHADVAAGTMMGLPCLRLCDAFFAARDHRSGDLIVKLPRHRVQQLIATGAGKPFAPAGKTFREWVVIDDRDPARWATLIDEARTFAAARVFTAD